MRWQYLEVWQPQRRDVVVLETERVTVDYLARRRAEGKSDREIRRSIKRYITRQLYRTLTAAMNPHIATST